MLSCDERTSILGPISTLCYFAFNTSYNNRTGFTPFYINHGFEANLPGQLPMAMHQQEATKQITILPSSYCAEVLTKFQTCFQLVLQNLSAASMKHTNVQDVPKYFSVGDEVLLFSPVLHKHTPKTLQNSGLDLILSPDKSVQWFLKFKRMIILKIKTLFMSQD